jgi:hypothetical protein
VFVQPFFDELPVVIRHAALDALVHEVVRAIEHDTHTDQPPLHHFIEVAREPVENRVPHGGRQLRVDLGGRQRCLGLNGRLGRRRLLGGRWRLVLPASEQRQADTTNRTAANSILGLKMASAIRCDDAENKA